MDVTIMYPENCRKSIRKIVNAVNTNVETAYAMMLMTALLMDLQPDDENVVQMILRDCGADDGDVA